MRSLAVVICLILSMSLGSARADLRIAGQFMGDAKRVGLSTLTYLFWDVYKAELFAENGVYRPDGPYALTLTYFLDFTSADIAERSLSEMHALTTIETTDSNAWLQEMQAIFPNVVAGDRLTGVRNVEGASRFYLNDVFLGAIEDPAFSDAFFAIWLHDDVRDIEFRRRLLGQS